MLMLPGHMTRFQTMADGGGRLQFDCQELTPAEFAEVGKCNKKVGLVVFYPDRENELTAPEKDAIRDSAAGALGRKPTKSKSQRLRLELMAWWEDDEQGFDKFEDFYAHFMDKFIDHVKSKRA